MLKWIYIGFAICFFLGRVYEAERQEDMRRKGTLYTIGRRERRWR